MSAARPSKRKRQNPPAKELYYSLPARANFSTFKDFLGMIMIDCLDRLEKVAKASKVLEMKKLHTKWEAALDAQKKASAAERKSTTELLDALETKMSVIKDVNLERIARSTLHKRIIKDEILSRDRRLAKVVSQDLSASKRERKHSPTKEEVDLDARITNTQAMKRELAASLNQLHRAVQFEDPGDESPSEDDKAELSDDAASSGSPKEEDEDEEVDERDDSWNGFGDFAEPLGVVSDDHSDRLSHLDDEEEPLDDGWESGSVDSTGQVISSGLHFPGSDSDDDGDHIDLNLGDSGSESGSQSETLEVRPPKRQKRSAAPVKATTSSSGNIFLPSLASGFMPGALDPKDDWENFDVDGPVRKNRRGQRARRAILERTYGKEANHLKGKPEALSSRPLRAKPPFTKKKPGERKPIPSKTHTVKGDEFFDPAGRGAGADKPFKTQYVPPKPLRPDRRQKPPAPAPKPQVQDRPVHPSWEAKQKLKQKEMARPQGKKVVFS